MNKIYKKKNKTLILCTLAASIMIASNADYQIIYDLSDNPIIFKNLTSYPSLYSEWIKIGNVTDCINWTPEANTIDFGLTFTQTSENCKQNEERTVTTRKIDQETQIVTETGTYKENRIVNATNIRESIGTKENWLITTPIYTDWIGNGEITNCNNWSPLEETIAINQEFTQTATDCQQNQTRSRQDREIGQHSNEIRNVGNPIEESRIGTTTSERTAIGTKENWIVGTPTYTEWVDENALYNCSNWTPSGSSKNSTETFNQISNNCKTDQTRTRQNREQESTTLEYKNVGDPIVENNTLNNQTANRSYTVTIGNWVNNGGLTGCSNWSPETNTVTVGQSFIQTATDCVQNQTRTRSESYVDHKTNETITVLNTNESQNITTTSTRNATGGKEEWVTATPSYGTWVVTNNLYNCTNWTPTGASKTATETFTQTATDCKVDRQRTVQNREQETTTLEYRNVGSQTTESATLNNQTATRSYTVTLGSWTNNGTLSNCTNWSPLASTQQKGISFTQTATDCEIPQIRTRVERYTDHLTGSIITVVNTNESRTGTTSNTRSAMGTNAIKTCYYNKGADANTWKFWAHGNSIWTGSTIPNVPVVWAMLYDFVIPYSNPVQYVQNLTKVSDTSLNYVAGGFTWNITRGSYVGAIDGFEMYQICIQ